MKIEDFAQFHTYKFGGSSLADANCFRRVADLILTQPCIVVVSAVAGTTQQLQNCIDAARQGQSFSALLSTIEQQHRALSDEMLPDAQAFHQQLTQDIAQLDALLSAIAIVGEAETALTERILGQGELWSAAILSAYLATHSPSVLHLDARDVLHVNTHTQPLTVDWQKSQHALIHRLTKTQDLQHIVLPGFVASDQQQRMCILGMNCSDYSAAIFAKLFQTASLVIWTDVDGIMSADPNQVPEAFTLPYLSYKEALELAYFGASVVHPKAIAPAMSADIPIYIKHTFKPTHAGTTIAKRTRPAQSMIKGLSCIQNAALITVEGAGMIGVSGIAARTFSALELSHVSVILISQASSEYSICVAVEAQDAAIAQQALEQTFSLELQANSIERIKCETDLAIIAAVGDGMVGQIGLSGQLCQSLAKAHINIHAIAQGGSERNVSLVVSQQTQARALRVLHSAFHLSDKRIAIALIGPGTIGACLLEQLHHTQQNLRDQQHLDMHCVALMNSKRMVLQAQPLDLSSWADALNQSAITPDIDALTDFLHQHDIPRKVIIDTTANPKIADYYADWLAQGIHVITPNKFANSGSWDYYQTLRKLQHEKRAHYYYETTVCAGLPVISTLQDLRNTGDTILSIEGVFSGTLSFVFDQLKQGYSFADAIHTAHSKGYTEPDPREDLSGMDVARKTICLAREVGLTLSAEDFEVTSLVPKALASVATSDFMAQLETHQTEISQSLEQVKTAASPILQYVGRIDCETGQASVGIRAYDHQHPIANLRGTDNIVIIKTQRYSEQPLVTQGPGAGPEVTASGVFADLLRLATRI